MIYISIKEYLTMIFTQKIKTAFSTFGWPQFRKCYGCPLVLLLVCSKTPSLEYILLQKSELKSRLFTILFTIDLYDFIWSKNCVFLLESLPNLIKYINITEIPHYFLISRELFLYSIRNSTSAFSCNIDYFLTGLTYLLQFSSDKVYLS